MAQTGNPEKTVPRASQKAISKVTLFGQIGKPHDVVSFFTQITST